MGTWMGLCSGNPGLGAGDSRSSLLPQLPAMDTWVRSGPLSLPLRAKGQPRLQPFPPLLARGAVSQHIPVPPLGWKWSLCFPRLVTPNLACQTLLAQPSSSSGSVWERCQVPQICPPFQCLPWTQRAPCCYPDFPCPGRWLCCKVGVSEGEEMPLFPSASSLCPDPPLVLHPLLPNRKAPSASGSSIPAPPVVPSGSA